ncbi:hypothetical protein FGD71_011725 [Streptomyces sporangiiformans]|uniref:Uncharacterized protein n=1 Tax=Streptomyces sporangiiformans TaxID=2315329 RepID=A0A505DG71_9ACTN|nr:hypothetical protein FGD71_011725 [Streptomyces sporangiiformans]
MRQQIYEFPELASEEEPSGVGAYISDALSALYYAYSYMATGDTSWVSYCSAVLMDSAHFLDEASNSGRATKQSELAEQLKYLDLLSVDTSVDASSVARVRDEARTEARQRVDLLKTIGFR